MPLFPIDKLHKNDGLVTSYHNSGDQVMVYRWEPTWEGLNDLAKVLMKDVKDPTHPIIQMDAAIMAQAGAVELAKRGLLP